jgi:tetratricopeptide (TPR) repeat protein
MILLTGAARAYMYAVYLAQVGKPGRAISFLTVADGLADDQERPYVSHLRSVFEFLSGDAETAVEIALEAKESAQDLADRELQRDVLVHLAKMQREMGNIIAAEEYEREAERIYRTARRINEKVWKAE